VRAGVLRGVLKVLAQALHDEGYLDLQETFMLHLACCLILLRGL
jgi:hypothetical protein